MKDRIFLFFASAGFIGLIPGAPGTYASVATTIAFFLVYRIRHRILPELHLSVICLVVVIGVLVANQVSKTCGNEDPSVVVIDEVAGQLLTFLFVPVHFWNLAIGTVLFRVFDIWKPGPIDSVQSLPRGFGIMADDVLAGVAAGMVADAVASFL